MCPSFHANVAHKLLMRRAQVIRLPTRARVRAEDDRFRACRVQHGFHVLLFTGGGGGGVFSGVRVIVKKHAFHSHETATTRTRRAQIVKYYLYVFPPAKTQ